MGVQRVFSSLLILPIRPGPRTGIAFHEASGCRSPVCQRICEGVNVESAPHPSVAGLSLAARNVMVYLLHDPDACVAITMGWTVVSSRSLREGREIVAGPPIPEASALEELAESGFLSSEEGTRVGRVYRVSEEMRRAF